MPSFSGFGRVLMITGVVLLVVGALVSFGGQFLSLGRLPGDIVIKRKNFTFYFPIMSSIILSLGLTILLWLLRKK